MMREPEKRIRPTADADCAGASTTPGAISPRVRSGLSAFCALSLLLMLSTLGAAPASAESVLRTHIGEKLALSENPVDVGLRPLDALMTVPDPIYIWHGDTTDADLAYAVTLGNDPDLEKRNSFRKHNFDLFRSERRVLVGQQEMLLRFRVRAKSTNTMSVELKF